MGRRFIVSVASATTSISHQYHLYQVIGILYKINFILSCVVLIIFFFFII